MLAVAFLLIWVGRPHKGGDHPKFLQFHAALVLYPPVVLTFLALGTAAVHFWLIGEVRPQAGYVFLTGLRPTMTREREK